MCQRDFEPADNQKVVVSIDIGTTSISWVVVDLFHKSVYESSCISPDRAMYDTRRGVIQSVSVITNAIEEILKTLQKNILPLPPLL